MRYNHINFGARPLATADVLKKIKGQADKYIPAKTSIIEIDFSKETDVKMLEQIKENWNGCTLTPMICNISGNPSRKIYAITTQQDNLESPIAEEILGLADLDFSHGKDNATLRFLQSKFPFKNNEERPVADVGKSFLIGLVNYFEKLQIKSMDLFADARVKPFYRKVFPEIKDKESTQDSYTNLILNI